MENLQKLETAKTRITECLDESVTFAQAVKALKARHEALEKEFWALFEEVKQTSKGGAKKRTVKGEAKKEGEATKKVDKAEEKRLNELETERLEVAESLKKWRQGFVGVQRSLKRWQAMYVAAVEELVKEVGEYTA